MILSSPLCDCVPAYSSPERKSSSNTVHEQARGNYRRNGIFFVIVDVSYSFKRACLQQAHHFAFLTRKEMLKQDWVAASVKGAVHHEVLIGGLAERWRRGSGFCTRVSVCLSSPCVSWRSQSHRITGTKQTRGDTRNVAALSWTAGAIRVSYTSPTTAFHCEPAERTWTDGKTDCCWLETGVSCSRWARRMSAADATIQPTWGCGANATGWDLTQTSKSSFRKVKTSNWVL